MSSISRARCRPAPVTQARLSWERETARSLIKQWIKAVLEINQHYYIIGGDRNNINGRQFMQAFSHH